VFIVVKTVFCATHQDASNASNAFLAISWNLLNVFIVVLVAKLVIFQMNASNASLIFFKQQF
jgi:hypothetical protein